MKSYWENAISRRRMLRLTAAAAGGAGMLALAACGGKPGSGKSDAKASGLLGKVEDTTSKATRGGTYTYAINADVTSLDAIGGGASASRLNQSVAVFTYPFLIRNKMVKSPARYANEVEADAATAWEITPDGLQYTFKMRPNNKLDARAPTNGRPLDAQDVAWSWKYFASDSSSRTILSNPAAADAPIVSMTSTDNQTLVVKLAFPYAPLLQMLAYNRHMPIMPREADPGPRAFDMRSDMRGSGGFYLDSYQRSSVLQFKKNPDWFDADKVFLDGVDVYIMPEYSTQLAQLRAGHLWSLTPDVGGVLPQDILPTKKDVPSLLLLQDDAFTKSTQPFIAFGALPGSPFLDVRTRQAASMLIDRELFIDTFWNVQEFAKAGVPVETRWNSHVAAGEEAVWVDPKDKDMGAGGANFKHDPAEAKKLLTAGGFSSAIETVFNYSTNAYPQPFGNWCEVLKGMFEEGGNFKFKVNNPDYQTEWLPRYHYGNGKYEGIAIGEGNTYPEIDGHLQAYFRGGSIRVWRGWPDTQMDSMIDAQRRELDPQKRIALVKDFERYAATTLPGLIGPGAALGFTLRQGWIGNASLWRGTGSAMQSFSNIWYDKSKAKA